MLSNFLIGMNETNLTQRARSTDVNASHIFSSKGYDENFEKWGNLLTLSLQNRDESQSDKSEKTKSFIAETKSRL